jgi:asparagine synthase (glutamine-hydrolysing)
MGFPTPLRQWLREERSQALFSLLTDPSGLLAGYLDLKSVAGLLNRHQRGIEDATDRIWRLLNLQIWGDLYIRGKTSHRLEGLFPKAAATV